MQFDGEIVVRVLYGQEAIKRVTRHEQACQYCIRATLEKCLSVERVRKRKPPNPGRCGGPE